MSANLIVGRNAATGKQTVRDSDGMERSFELQFVGQSRFDKMAGRKYNDLIAGWSASLTYKCKKVFSLPDSGS